MRRDKNKDKKGQESLIGKIIYSSLLFSPLIAIACAVLISTFNMSAKEETEIHYKYETNEVNSQNDLVVGNVYHFNFSGKQPSNIVMTGNDYIEFKPLTNFTLLDAQGDEVYVEDRDIELPYVSCYMTNDALLIQYDEFGNNYSSFLNFQFTSNFDAIFLNISSNVNYTLITSSNYNEIESVETHNVSPQDVFYTAVNKVEDSNLFNWSKNSIVYTTMNATCNQLHITTTFIPMLLSYWLIISVIYFLYDIALMLIWLLHNKIHELQESI